MHPDTPSITRTTRRFQLAIGPVSILRERIVEQASWQVRAPAPRMLRLPSIADALVALGSVAALGLVGVNSPHASAAASPKVLSIAVPPPAPTGPEVAPPHPAMMAAPARHAEPARRRAVAPAPIIAAPDETEQVRQGEEAAFTTRDAAMRAALRTGTMQEWRDAGDGAHGFVVVGPEGEGGCRAISVLTRRGEQSDVDSQTRCAVEPSPA